MLCVRLSQPGVGTLAALRAAAEHAVLGLVPAPIPVNSSHSNYTNLALYVNAGSANSLAEQRSGHAGHGVRQNRAVSCNHVAEY